MKCRRVVLTAIALIAVLVATTFLVAGSGGGKDTATALGEVTSIDYGSKSFVIDVRKSNRLVDQDPLTVIATESTIIKECLGSGESVRIDFEEIEVGDWVRLDGDMDGVELVARRITVNPENIPAP